MVFSKGLIKPESPISNKPNQNVNSNVKKAESAVNVNLLDKTAIQEKPHVESFQYPLGPRVVCEDITLAPCGENTV